MNAKQAYLNELINSRITLNEKETQIVEDYIFSKSKVVSNRYLTDAKCKAAINGK